MPTDTDCRSRAELCLAQIAQQCAEDLTLLPEPYETSLTLASSYQTTDYLTTGDATYALAGMHLPSPRPRFGTARETRWVKS
jgi:hypothetical protein